MDDRRGQIYETYPAVLPLDPGAFVIVQEAHQVLGDGFGRYNKQSL